MHVVFATAEFTGIAAVGGLAQAASGLVHELRRQGVTVELVVPDYGHILIDDEQWETLDVPYWVGSSVVRRGVHAVAGPVSLVSVEGMERAHPYLDPSGTGWWDNDARFLRFSRAVAELYRRSGADVLHLNDWHTAAALAAFDVTPPSVLSIHNLAYQGTTSGEWLGRIGPRSMAYEWWGATNPFKGGLELASAIVAVSPHYAEEIQRPESGFGVDGLLRSRTDDLVGIRNGIDTRVWDPSSDTHLPKRYDVGNLRGKAAARAALLARLNLPTPPGPVIAMVTRLTEQKGVDLVAPLAPFLERLGACLVVLGSGERPLADQLWHAAATCPSTVAFVEGYDDPLSHLMFAGADLFLMPSRFEPCGLAQMQAMRYGTLPIGVDVGGLHDTIADADARPEEATGWLADRPTALDILDAVHRAVRGWLKRPLRSAMQQRGMTTDWSWRGPALEHVALYERVSSP